MTRRNYAEHREMLTRYVCRLKKHRGKSWAQILDEDEDYCRWAMNNVDEDPDIFPEEVKEALLAMLDDW